MIAESIGAASLAIWLYLLLGRGGFWRLREKPQPIGPAPTLSVAVIIPARDEADGIGDAARSLLTQRYSGDIQVFIVDDHSSDDTAAIALGAAAALGAPDRLTVLAAGPLPQGWTGKLWALATGVERAALMRPDYFLFTDADIVHALDNVANLVARAESGGFDLVSLMVKLRCRSVAERALIPAFVFFFLKLYPPAWAKGAAGGCILIRPQALERIGGIASIRAELIDDCALASSVKRSGSVWMGFTHGTYSSRDYKTFEEIGRMIARTAFTQLRHSTLLLVGTLLGLAVTYLAPPVLALAGPSIVTRALGLTAWLLMSVTFLPTLKFYGRSPVWAPALPLIALFYLGATIHSAVAYWSGRGGLWKGRVQDLR